MAYFLLETTSTGKDYLTKVYNRQSFEDYTNQMIEKKKDFVLLIFDLDRFKEINDQHGHLIGDLVLFEFANSLTKIFSKLGMVARLGGDEFIVFHENCDQCHIEDSIKELKTVLKNSKIPQIQSITFSYGYEPSTINATYDELYFKVDQKMYQNKSR